MARFADGLITRGLIFLGLVLMMTPLALWVAWTETIFLGVLATGAAALLLYGVLDSFERPVGPARSGASGGARAKILPDGMIAELQNLHPFIHHHQPSGGPKFHAAMSRLKRLLYREPG